MGPRPPRDDTPPPDDETSFTFDDDPTAIPLARNGDGIPGDHISFNAFWRSLGFEDDAESRRLRELFFEWLGQGRYDVHDRDEPTVFGDAAGWRLTWARYLSTRKLK